MRRTMMAVPLAALVVAVVACTSGSASGLVGPTWQWTHLTENHPKHQSVVTDPTSYTLTLKSDGTFGARVDCNHMSGTYTTSDSSITLKPGATTAVGCAPNSLGARYMALLSAVGSYSIDGKNMTMQLAHDAGEMGFVQG
jgi:heat shock protein HslJ